MTDSLTVLVIVLISQWKKNPKAIFRAGSVQGAQKTMKNGIYAHQMETHQAHTHKNAHIQ